MGLGNPLKTPNRKEGRSGKVRMIFDVLWRVSEARATPRRKGGHFLFLKAIIVISIKVDLDKAWGRHKKRRPSRHTHIYRDISHPYEV
jgi:hypothetical protein